MQNISGTVHASEIVANTNPDTIYISPDRIVVRAQ